MSIKYLKNKSKLIWDFEINHTHLGPLLPHLSPYPPQTMDSMHNIKDLPHLFEKKKMFNYCPYWGHMIIMLNYGNKILTCNYDLGWNLCSLRNLKSDIIFSQNLYWYMLKKSQYGYQIILLIWHNSSTPIWTFEVDKCVNMTMKLIVEMNVLNMHQHFFEGFLEETKMVRCFQHLVDKWQLVKF